MSALIIKESHFFLLYFESMLSLFFHLYLTPKLYIQPYNSSFANEFAVNPAKISILKTEKNLKTLKLLQYPSIIGIYTGLYTHVLGLHDLAQYFIFLSPISFQVFVFSNPRFPDLKPFLSTRVNSLIQVFSNPWFPDLKPLL